VSGRKNVELKSDKAAIFALNFADDGQRALSASSERIRVWDLKQMDERCSFRLDKLSAAALSPDGTHVLTGDTDGVVRLWRLPE
jgi:WD40 repeat protein